MEITVLIPEGETKHLEVSLETKILEVKNRLELVTEIPVDSQALYCCYAELPPGNQTLNQLGISPNAVFELRDKDVIDISVETFKHGTKRLTVNRRMKILEFQRKLHVVTQIPSDFQLLCQNHKRVSLSKENTLRELGILHNAKFFIYDKRATIEISILTPSNGTKSLILNPTTDIQDLQMNLERQTRIPIRSQILFQNNINLSLCKLSLRQLGISSGAVFQLYDERGHIKISVITPEQGELRLAVIEMVEIVELQTTLQELTQIPIQDQMLFHNKINLALSRQTFLQLGILSHAEFILFNKCTIFTIKLHIIYNGGIREYKLVPQQTIKLLIQAVQLTWPAKHLCDRSAITFVCRPNPDGSHGTYDNAIDVETTFAELQVKQGEIFCVGIISMDTVNSASQYN